MLADRSRDADRFRDALKDNNISACIFGRKNRNTTVRYDKRRYKLRNRIEIMFVRLKEWKCPATRCDRCPTVFLSAVTLFATVLTLNLMLMWLEPSPNLCGASTWHHDHARKPCGSAHPTPASCGVLSSPQRRSVICRACRFRSVVARPHAGGTGGQCRRMRHSFARSLAIKGRFQAHPCKSLHGRVSWLRSRGKGPSRLVVGTSPGEVSAARATGV
mgnify:CR=1 FL=1